MLTNPSFEIWVVTKIYFPFRTFTYLLFGAASSVILYVYVSIIKLFSLISVLSFTALLFHKMAVSVPLCLVIVNSFLGNVLFAVSFNTTSTLYLTGICLKNTFNTVVPSPFIASSATMLPAWVS